MIGMVALCVALAALLLAFFAWQQAKGAMSVADAARRRAEEAWIDAREANRGVKFVSDQQESFRQFVPRRTFVEESVRELAEAAGFEWYSEPPKSGWRKAGKR